MKSKFTAVLSLLLMLTPLTMLAAERNSRTVKFSDAVTVGGTQVPAGTYRVQWEGTGNVTATINQGKKVVASVPATVVETKSGYDGALQTEGNVLQGIQWKNQSIQFDQSKAAAPSSGN